MAQRFSVWWLHAGSRHRLWWIRYWLIDCGEFAIDVSTWSDRYTRELTVRIEHQLRSLEHMVQREPGWSKSVCGMQRPVASENIWEYQRNFVCSISSNTTCRFRASTHVQVCVYMFDDGTMAVQVRPFTSLPCVVKLWTLVGLIRHSWCIVVFFVLIFFLAWNSYWAEAETLKLELLLPWPMELWCERLHSSSPNHSWYPKDSHYERAKIILYFLLWLSY